MRFICLCFCLFAGSSLAAVVEKTFNPQVTIVKNTPSDSLRITIEQSDFISTYSLSLETFQPINIPFTVHSINDTPLDYTIKLQDSQHHCREDGQTERALSGVRTTLDGVEFAVKGEGVEVSDSKESAHLMYVEFPKVSQIEVEQACYGTFIVIAEKGVI
ncbi:hypothetical protein [Shewanella colwelliana]|uniref:hypothetical protein n=1 Tax=Shewanella colwelliana TaxID=23 RepID=UPI003736FC2F